MKILHASEQNIQDYVFDVTNCDKAIVQHISSCDQCKRLADSYTALASALKEQPQPIPDPNLADLVMKKIPTMIASPQSKKYNINSAFIIMGVGFVALLFRAMNYEPIHFVDSSDASNYLIISIGFFITILWASDMISSFLKNMNRMNFP